MDSRARPSPLAKKSTTSGGEATNDDGTKWKRLVGVYKTFFKPSHYATVEQWYNQVASTQHRHALKALVKEVLAFDMTDAIAKAGKATYSPDITSANAIVNHNGGEFLSDRGKLKTVEYLSMAHPAKRELFRNTFGLIRQPSNLCTLRHIADMDPSRTFVEVETSLVPKKKLVGSEHLHRRSEMLTLPANAQTGHSSSYQQTYVWKTGTVPLAFSQRAIDRRDAQLAQQQANDKLVDAVQAHIRSGVTTEFSSPVGFRSSANLLANPSAAGFDPAVLQYTPYGVLDTKNVDGTQWESHTHDAFKGTYYLQPKDERRFQNLNDNYSRMVYLSRRKAKRAVKAEALLSASSAASLSADATLMRSTLPLPSRTAGRLQTAMSDEPLQSTQFGSTVDDWLDTKRRRPVSVIFPSI